MQTDQEEAGIVDYLFATGETYDAFLSWNEMEIQNGRITRGQTSRSSSDWRNSRPHPGAIPPVQYHDN